MKEFNFKGTHEFCVCIDSDGTIFDNMELKHKECFCPAFINAFGLQSVSRYAREVWEYVNLYSPSRGINRFKAMTEAVELLGRRKEVAQRGVTIPDLSGLRECVDAGITSGAVLKDYVAAHPDNAAAAMGLACSEEIDANVARIVHGVAPLPGAVEAMKRLKEACDIVIVSDTPHDNLEREWKTQGLWDYPDYFTGQEFGGKGRCIAAAKEQNGYDQTHILMIGDAPRDVAAAKDNGALCFPIVPGREDQSWNTFLRDGLGRFLAGTYAGEYEHGLREAFSCALSDTPAWES